jgi:hypothetical protein
MEASMQKNEYRLFNGPAIQMSFSRFKSMMEKGQYKTPSFDKVIRFDNDARFLADVTCLYEGENFGIITVNYGNIFDVLNDRDTYHEFYSMFLHKNYPLIVNGRILLSTGRVDIVLTDADRKKDSCPPSGYTRFNSNIPGRNTDTRGVQIIRSDEISDYVTILSRKEHYLGDITAPHLSNFSKEEVSILRGMNLIDTADHMYENWDELSYEDKVQADIFQADGKKVGKDIYNEALTGGFSVYEIEISTHNFNIDRSNTVLFENIFQDNICLKRDFPVYEDQSDYWVESSVMPGLMEEKLNITTSLLLTDINPDANGKIRIKVVNKLINDVRTDHGWYM